MTNKNKQTDYSNGKIYVIISPNCELVYYGSTTDTLKKRFDNHKFKRECTSKKIIDAGESDIYEIEKYPCSCKEELEDREAFYILNDWNGCVNECVPGAVRRAGGRKAYKKINDSKPEVKAHKAEKIMCNVCGCMIRRDHMSKHQKSKTCQKFLKNELDELLNDMIKQIEIEN